MIQLIAFLGNYGQEYEHTRHNAPWLFADSLPFASRLSWAEKYKGKFCSVDYVGFAGWLADFGLLAPRADGSLPLPAKAPRNLYFLKPLTYMNLSGEAVGEAARFYKIEPADILIVHDEIELPFGTVSFKWAGGLGGHNGLRSIKSVLGTADFWRLRIGVGKPASGDVAGYVLGNFTADEDICLSQLFPQLAGLFAKVLCSAAPEKLIPEWGKKKLIAEKA